MWFQIKMYSIVRILQIKNWRKKTDMNIVTNRKFKLKILWNFSLMMRDIDMLHAINHMKLNTDGLK